MPNYMADSAEDIAKRIHDIRKEEGLRDDNWRTATGSDLDAIAAAYDVKRDPTYESDSTLRARIEAAINKRKAAR